MFIWQVPPITAPSTTLKLYPIALDDSTRHEHTLSSQNGEKISGGGIIEKNEGQISLGSRLDLS